MELECGCWKVVAVRLLPLVSLQLVTIERIAHGDHLHHRGARVLVHSARIRPRRTDNS